MPLVRHTVPGASSKDQAVNLFYQSLQESNGTRRASPEELFPIKRVTCAHGLWTVYYEAPARIVREITRSVKT